MAQKIQKVGVKREAGYLYFIDKQGDVSKALMARGGKKGGKPQKVARVGLKKEAGYLYFLDKYGDISRSVMSDVSRPLKPVKKTALTKLSKEKKLVAIEREQVKRRETCHIQTGAKKSAKTESENTTKHQSADNVDIDSDWLYE